MSVTRRNFLRLAPVALAPLTLAGARLSAAADEPAPAPAPTVSAPPSAFVGPPDAAFPSHPPALAREMVISAHGNVPRVRDLLSRWPTLAKAAIDWGYGDWEDALGAASHVGNREIARMLLANGARPTLFSAAMMGELEVVKAFLTPSPDLAGIYGPHGISLLRHAMAGGAASQAVVDYLKTLPAADRRPEPQPITVEVLKQLTGTYSFGLDVADKFVVELKEANLSIARVGRYPRGLTHLGERAFFPAGAPEVRIRFSERLGKAVVSVFDPDLLVTAEKVG